MSHSNQATASAIVAPELSIVEGRITTTSRQIADHFGKVHRDVVRAIENLECSADFRLRNFAQSSFDALMPKGGARSHKSFRMTRDGFVFLAMGFTGKDAALWKEAYIAAFNRMESELLAKATRSKNLAAKYEPIDPLNGPALVAARQVAENYFEACRQAVKSGHPAPHMGELPQEVLHGMVARALFGQRMLSWFDWSTGAMGCKLVPSDSSVFSLASGNYFDLLQQVPMDRLPELAEAVNQRVACHLGAFKRHLQRAAKQPQPGALCPAGAIHA